MKTTTLRIVAKELNRLNKVMEANRETSKQISKEANKWGKTTLTNNNLANRFRLSRS